MPLSPVNGVSFYLILAVAYMYLVTLLAFFMYRYPDNRIIPVLLINGKFASSLMSLGFFLMHQHFLIYLTNFIMDGFIAVMILILYNVMVKNSK